MQINRFKILIVFVLALNSLFSLAQNQTLSANLLLITDRDYCVSGDSVWFKVWLPDSLKNKGNVVHLQLDTKNGNLISSVVKKSNQNWAEGFIPVPDSLSTGQCFITAFLNAEREKEVLITTAKSLVVFNRFEEAVVEMDLLEPDGLLVQQKNSLEIKIETDKEQYLARDKVKINVLSELDIKEAVIKASRIDPFAEKVGGKYIFEHRSSFPAVPDFVEQNGVLVSGKVTDKTGQVQSKTLVVISISGDPSYFDYYITGTDGDFHFFLENAKGEATVVIQSISERRKDFTISVEVNALERTGEYNSVIKMMTPAESESAISVIKGDFFNKLFRGSVALPKVEFEMPMRFEMPFYGVPTQRVVLSEFFDLSDFNEISRELLQGVQFRQRKDLTTIRLVSNANHAFFDDEPLRLLNGIPIFKNSLLASLNSTDINFIDIVQDERLFGDVKFNGVLAVSLHDKSNSWIVQQPNIFQFKVNCLQPAKIPGYLQQQTLDNNQPDTRQVYLWNLTDKWESGDFEFQLSDLKGKVEITIEGVTADNKEFRTTKIIEVK